MNEFLQAMQPSVVTALGLVLTALTGFVVSYINKKNKELQGNIDSNLAKKYMDMVAQTITDCVKEVSQTYVDSIKKEGAFIICSHFARLYSISFLNLLSTLVGGIYTPPPTKDLFGSICK